MRKIIKDYLVDILTECNYLLNRSKELTYEEFIQDEDLKRAFVRNLEVIGEAAKKIPNDIREKYPQIPWKAMSGI